MSGYVTGLVFKHSTMRGSARLVMAVIADACDDDGTNAWPSVDTIAARAGIDERYARRVIRQCEEAGELVVEVKTGGPVDRRADRRSNRYSIPIRAWVEAEARGGPLTPSSTSRGGSLTPSSAVHEGVPRPPYPSLKETTKKTNTTKTTTLPKRSRITEAWRPSDRTLAWMLQQHPGVSVDEREQFIDHHLARGSLMVDWDRAFMTWVRNADKWSERRRATADKQEQRRSELLSLIEGGDKT